MNFEQSVDNYVAEKLTKHHLPGLSIAVVKQGALILSKGYGWANVELKAPATAETVYEIASITKSFTATAIMMLVEEGRLKLTDPVPLYRSGLRNEWNNITIQHLLSHTAGLNYWSVDWFRQDLTADEVCRDVFESLLRFAPGTQFEYNDVGYNVLGMIIHTVTGKPYEQFLQERVFLPLGMAATQANQWRAIVPNRAAGYAWENDKLSNSLGIHWHALSNTASDVPANGANGSLLSTVHDFAKWDAALYGDALLQPATLRKMWTPNRLIDGSVTEYGLGWQVYENAAYHGGRTIVAHSGGNPGFTTHFGRYPAEQVSFAVFINRGDAEPWEIGRDVIGLLR